MDLNQRDLKRQEAEAIFERLAGLPDAVRQAITDSLWAKIPTYIVEKAYTTDTAATELAVPAATETPYLVQYATIWTPGTGAVLTLGDWQTPLAAGLNSFRPYLILNRTDVRKLVSATNPGAMSVVLAGEPLPTFGVLPGY